MIERAGSTLYCTALYFDPQHGLVGKHRKLMPTGTERLIWGKGDGSTLPVLDTQVGRVGAVICWENMMPLLRTAMYAKGVDVWCAPTVDEREMWQVSMRHIAHEGRCFVVSACQVQASPQELGLEIANWPAERPLIAGGSLIVGPMGEVLAGPLVGRAGLLTAQIDTAELVRARYDYDVVGHYARPDVFELTVDERAKAGVRFIWRRRHCSRVISQISRGNRPQTKSSSSLRIKRMPLRSEIRREARFGAALGTRIARAPALRTSTR